MDFEFNAEQKKLREEVREFLNAELPPDWVGFVGTTVDDSVDHRPDGMQIFKKIASGMGKRGWIGMTWPEEYGGSHRSYIDYLVFLEEVAKRGSPGFNAIGAKMFCPTLIQFGTDEQKKRFLPPIAAGMEYYTEGFSEPEAGSDLAALQTRAVRDGNYYIVNGQKTWQSLSPYADWCCCLARTDPGSQRHRGLSLIIISLKEPGVTVRPIANLLDEPHFGEIFFEDVKVQVENRLGPENEGWLIAQTFLSHERVSIAPFGVMETLVERLIQFAKTAPAADRQRIREVATELAVETDIGRLLAYQVAWLEDQGKATEWHAAMTRMYGTALWKKAASKVITLLGPYGYLTYHDDRAPLKGYFEHLYLSAIGATIAAGTTEIQKTVIAVRGLGMKSS